MNKKNKRLFFALLGLTFCTVVIIFIKPSARGQQLNTALFAIADTAAIQKIVISHENKVEQIERSGSVWTLNDEYPVDDYIRQLMLAVLQRVEPMREVSKAQYAKIDSLFNQGYNVEVFDEEGVMKSFSVTGNANKTESYFKITDANEIYQVRLPGYKSYVAGIFELDASTLRDKTLFSAHWSEINQLKVSYPKDSSLNFVIYHKGGALSMDLDNLDSAAMMTYVNIFGQLTASSYLETDSTFEESLINGPLFEIELSSLGNETNKLSVYNDQEYVVRARNTKGEWVGLDPRLVSVLRREKNDFALAPK